MRWLHLHAGERAGVDADVQGAMLWIVLDGQHLDLAGAGDVEIAPVPEGSHLGLHLVQRHETLVVWACGPLV
jgi:hypothetical protein